MVTVGAMACHRPLCVTVLDDIPVYVTYNESLSFNHVKRLYAQLSLYDT